MTQPQAMAENIWGYVFILCAILAWIGWMAWKYRNDRYASEDWMDRHIDNEGKYRP